MNTYHKYYPNVFLAKCTEPHQKGETVMVTTQYGKENTCIIHNLIGQKDGFYFYSITREDGTNTQTRAQAKSDRYSGWSVSAIQKSKNSFEAANEGRDFLSLGEPIKVGHHSEKRHRALIERNHQRMKKGFEYQEKAEAHESKADYWAKKTKEINLSMPESLPYFEAKLAEAITYHEGLKNGTIKRPHGLALSYAAKAVKDLKNKIETAKKLWA